jgi:hypothetical protein
LPRSGLASKYCATLNFGTAGGFALSNSTGLSNLWQIAEPGMVAAAASAFDRHLSACGEPELEPYSKAIDQAKSIWLVSDLAGETG